MSLQDISVLTGALLLVLGLVFFMVAVEVHSSREDAEEQARKRRD